MTLSLMIKRKYLREKVDEQIATGVFHERREYKPFWRKRIGSPGVWKHRGHPRAIFLCGIHVFRADVLNISIEETPSDIPRIGDVVPGKICYNIECRFLQWDLEYALCCVDEATKEIGELIKQDFCTIVQREKLHERKV